jgi:hypothetical protein
MPKALWECPTCRRKFAKENQWHSCRPVSVDTHFKGKPADLKALFEEFCARLRTCGPLRTDAVKSSINLVSTHHFGGVRVQKDGLRVGFLLSRPVEHPRILRTEKITPTIWAHHVKITGTEDLDTDLLAWLKEAHARSTRKSNT